MKLVNYKRGYVKAFDCVIHGTLYVNQEEFNEIRNYLYTLSEYEKPYLFNKTRLIKDLCNKVYLHKCFAVNIGVSLMDLIAKKWNLQKYDIAQIKNSQQYKKGNYQIIVKE
jgi:hypothetical protein